MKTTIFQLERLTCPSCIHQIEQLLMRQEGVRFAKVLFHSNRVKVNYMDDLVTPEKLAVLLNRHDYPAFIHKIA